ncbi:hypothetical protein KAFR_0A03340 [Kazachstania africana CBS 2517]|uniref:Uncharacterized protein n=1 Tax=Kazachstania africana (strain ATCC 22294 / BCRC 22015 / CBS 2517 / CECT 1963 / NBRC 1671 / NRRL Y-8276) TaxID=1071382 RepID=H2AN19_KAZAF|nr:hypothetical protein KAFR_0A03340 [Kazachstania africana CBS 2517]CCF55769.1 hypothetical protein KAFR_0A03340 [Kazachstania africana CBS 2517]
MKLSNLILLSTSAVAFAAPAGHRHHEKRDIVTVTEYVDVNGNLIGYSDGSATTIAAAATGATSVTSASKPTTTLVGEAVSVAASTASSTTTSSESSTTTTSVSTSTSTSSISGDLTAFEDPTVEFQDGTIACTDFPSGQGVIPVDWVDMGGYTSIMNFDGDTSTTCQDGYYCSYACQAGMSKTQWPSEQPSDGRSVGGLYCQNGYLYRSNTDTNYLCEWGQESASAVNNVSESIALCRTDYPGSENMNVPTLVEAGSSQPISVVNEDTYYMWEGQKTSTQYYVNNAGVSVEDGCIWGTEGSGVGNWAPVVLGAGYTDGNTYLSIIPNPNNKSAPNYNVKIVATDGSTINGDCSYVDGVFSGDNSDGCTVTVTSGSAQFVFY